jgi:2-aminoethylphosphonate transport system substrate-binding protein
VSKGELSVANSDVQMALQSISADKSAYEIFSPTASVGTRATVAVPYAMGLAAGAPHKDNADKLMGYLLSQKVQETISTSSSRPRTRSS